MAVKVICANAKSKIEVFKITINNNKIRIEKCNDRNILKKIKIVVKRHNEPRNPCTITSNSKNKS